MKIFCRAVNGSRWRASLALPSQQLAQQARGLGLVLKANGDDACAVSLDLDFDRADGGGAGPDGVERRDAAGGQAAADGGGAGQGNRRQLVSNAVAGHAMLTRGAVCAAQVIRAPSPQDGISSGLTGRHNFRMLILRAGRRCSSRYSRYGVSTSSIHFMNARTRRDRLLRCATTRDTASGRRRKSGMISTSVPLSKYRPIPKSGA
jgi:hypothetical protein